jgi:hypothetical protein
VGFCHCKGVRALATVSVRQWVSCCGELGAGAVLGAAQLSDPPEFSLHPRTQFSVFITTVPGRATPPPASHSSLPASCSHQPPSPPFQFSLFPGKLAGRGVLESKKQQVVGDPLLRGCIRKTDLFLLTYPYSRETLIPEHYSKTLRLDRV